jgi:hypothetical protein
MPVRLPGELEDAVESTYAAMIAHYIESVADWRRRRSQEEAWEPRHAIAAARLDQFAAFVRSLSEEDERIFTIGTLNRDGEQLVPGPIMANAVARFGFFAGEISDEALLARMVELAIEDRGQAGIDPLRDLPF